MRSAELLAWSLGLLEFEVPLEFDAATPLPDEVPTLHEHRYVFRYFQADEAGRFRYSMPVGLRLLAQDAAIHAELQPLPGLQLGRFTSCVEVADRLNRLGYAASACHDPQAQTLLLRSRIRHQRHLATPDGDVLPGHRESTLNWLADLLRFGREGAQLLAQLLRRPAYQPD